MAYWEQRTSPEYRKVKSGELLLVTEGEYSDYGVNLIVRALKEFDWAVLADTWEAKEQPYGNEEYDLENRVTYASPGQISFVSYLVREGYIEDVSYREFHMGSYGRFEPSIYNQD